MEGTLIFNSNAAMVQHPKKLMWQYKTFALGRLGGAYAPAKTVAKDHSPEELAFFNPTPYFFAVISLTEICHF